VRDFAKNFPQAACKMYILCSLTTACQTSF